MRRYRENITIYLVRSKHRSWVAKGREEENEESGGRLKDVMYRVLFDRRPLSVSASR